MVETVWLILQRDCVEEERSGLGRDPDRARFMAATSFAQKSKSPRCMRRSQSIVDALSSVVTFETYLQEIDLRPRCA